MSTHYFNRIKITLFNDESISIIRTLRNRKLKPLLKEGTVVWGFSWCVESVKVILVSMAT